MRTENDERLRIDWRRIGSGGEEKSGKDGGSKKHLEGL